jgi:hypothetical protein
LEIGTEASLAPALLELVLLKGGHFRVKDGRELVVFSAHVKWTADFD